MNRIFLLSFLIFCLSFVVETSAGGPNVILVLLDDAGWTDLGCYGADIDTPNMDGLAAGGMRFTDCHSAAPNCSPSRTGLLTGRTPSRAGVYSYLPSDHVMHLRDEEITVAELLHDAGYRTGHFGKWHLSELGSGQPQPADQGFEYSFGTDNNASPSHLDPENFVRNGEPVGKLEGYSCRIVVDETLSWLDRIGAGEEGADPFFACVWFHEPHTPIASPPDLVRKYRERLPDLSKREATYHANIENVDRAVGHLLERLSERGLEEDTLVFLTSDNGPLHAFSARGLRGRKSNVWEGGHRVFGLFRWPGRIPEGAVSDVPISGVDFLPTVCELAGIPAPGGRTIDGVSLAPVLLDGAGSLERSKPLYWFFYRLNPSVAIREGRWALVADTTDADRPKAHPLTREDMPGIRNAELTGFRLYDLEQDLAQETDLARDHPEVLERLRKRATAFHRGVVGEGHAWDIPAEYGEGKRRRIWNSE